MGKLTLPEKRKLKKVYYNPEEAASFSSPQKIYESLNKSISLSKIKEFLRGEETYTVQRNIRRKF